MSGSLGAFGTGQDDLPPSCGVPEMGLCPAPLATLDRSDILAIRSVLGSEGLAS